MFLRHLKISKFFSPCRFNSQQALCVKSLKFSKYGKPTEVLNLTDDELPPINPNQVLIKILAAPIHPGDLDLIQGERAGTVKEIGQVLPFIPGIECVAEVVDVGCYVQDLKIGQHVVVPYAEGRGTWTTHALYNVNDLAPISNEIPLETAALLTVNPFTAYRILKDFVALKAGDCVLLNGSSTALGQAMHQLCNAWDIKSVGLVRDTPQIDAAKKFIKSLGATEVMGLEEFLKSTIFEDGTLPNPRLSLSCVARSSSRELGRFLDQNGVMVTYGCMAGQPVATATAAFVFKDFVQRPFWMIRWSKYNPDVEERNRMLSEICCLVENQEFKTPEVEMVPFEKYKEALEEVEKYKGFTGKKFVLDMRNQE